MRARRSRILAAAVIAALMAAASRAGADDPPGAPPTAPSPEQPGIEPAPPAPAPAPPAAPSVVPPLPPAPSNTPAESELKPQPGTQRVILRVDRNTLIKGTIEEEDDAVIVVRDLAGQLQSMPKARVLEIVRLVEPRPDQNGTVLLRGGQRQRGVVIEDNYDYVLLEIEGVRSKLMREVVEHVVLEPSFEYRYKQYKESLKDYSAQRHFELCRWLFEPRRYDLARQELEDLLAQTKLPEAIELLRIVNAQLALKPIPRPKPAPADPDTPPDAPGPDEDAPGRAGEEDLLPTQILSREDVNIIRVYELDFADPPRVVVKPETIRKLIENYGSNDKMPTGSEARNALFRADSLQIVRLMFELRARELYPEIEVVGEPYSLNLFRQRVHNTWLVSGCASNACHGGANSGRLFLHRQNQRDERVRYTNLLTLERFKPSEEGWPLINYDDPMKSLIIQYGLPRAETHKAHPNVKGWNPVFTRANRRMLDGTIEWIHSMMQPRPAYPVSFEPQAPKGTRVPVLRPTNSERVPR